jgi:hypothetical protein
MTPRTLFTISADLLALADLLAETGGDITEADADAAITAWFAELGTDRDTKIDHYCALIRELEARQEIRTQEARRLMARAQTDEKTARAMSAIIGIPIVELIQGVTGGNDGSQRTLAHPKVAMNIAAWCSVEFEAQVYSWLVDWLESRLIVPPRTATELLHGGCNV